MPQASCFGAPVTWNLLVKNVKTICFFRVDASEAIGLGHVMRCLTLAQELYLHDVECVFLCRDLPKQIESKILNSRSAIKYLRYSTSSSGDPFEIDIEKDAALTLQSLCVYSNRTIYLVVDHYGIDVTWEKIVMPAVSRSLVIDDMANRSHLCDVLLDQTYNRRSDDYKWYVTSDTSILTGTQFALLRPEFNTSRKAALSRRLDHTKVKNILINFGGGDYNDLSSWCLRTIYNNFESSSLELTVVLGAAAQNQQEVQHLVARSMVPTKILFDVEDMYELMLKADVAIGAAGSTSWERCCLGLPTIMFVIAENQGKIAAELAKKGAVSLVEGDDLENTFINALENLFDKGDYQYQSQQAFSVCDGKGAGRVASVFLASSF